MRLLQCVGVCVLCGGLMLVTGGAARAQSGSGSGSGGSGSGSASGSGSGSGDGYGGGGRGGVSPATVQGMGTDDNIPPPNQRMEEDQIKLRNIERQKQLVDDTQRLVALANELKADVAKSTKDTLSLDVVRKADEIEKLAHNVKERMKNAN